MAPPCCQGCLAFTASYKLSIATHVDCGEADPLKPQLVSLRDDTTGRWYALWPAALQEEVGQQYVYIERLEQLVGTMQRQHCSSLMRADLLLLHLTKPRPGEGQRLAALKARSAIAARCQQGLQVQHSISCTSLCRPCYASVL